MPCLVVDLPGGGHAIVKVAPTRKKKCSVCGQPSDKLCDFPLQEGSTSRTCDLPLCKYCATHIAPDSDYCPAHTAEGRRLHERRIIP